MANARKNTIKLRALMGFSYAGKRREPGDEFRAESRDARLLIAAGRAEKVEPAKRQKTAPPPQDPAADNAPGTDAEGAPGEGGGDQTPPPSSDEASGEGLFAGDAHDDDAAGDAGDQHPAAAVTD